MDSSEYPNAFQVAKEDSKRAEVLSSTIEYQNMARGRKTYNENNDKVLSKYSIK